MLSLSTSSFSSTSNVALSANPASHFLIPITPQIAARSVKMNVMAISLPGFDSNQPTEPRPIVNANWQMKPATLPMNTTTVSIPAMLSLSA